MCCKCGKPVEKSIEGIIICVDCWTLAQMTEQEIAQDKEINEYHAITKRQKIPLALEIFTELGGGPVMMTVNGKGDGNAGIRWTARTNSGKKIISGETFHPYDGGGVDMDKKGLVLFKKEVIGHVGEFLAGSDSDILFCHCGADLIEQGNDVKCSNSECLAPVEGELI